MNKYNLKKINQLHKFNKLNLIKFGHTTDNKNFFSTDYYNINNILNYKIKDIKGLELLKIEKEDPYYFKYHTEQMYKEINRTNCLFGDLWRIGTKDKIIYLTVITPYLRDINKEFIDNEISNLIKKHYYILFGYDNIDINLIQNNINKYFEFKEDKNSPEQLIENWVLNNKNSAIYQYYKNLIIKHNDLAILQKEFSLSFYEYDKHSAEIIIPFNSELSYPELFKMILNGEIKTNEHLNEDYIQKDLKEDLKYFLSQFKYIENKKRKRK